MNRSWRSVCLSVYLVERGQDLELCLVVPGSRSIVSTCVIRVRVDILKNSGQSESCMVYKLRIIFKRTVVRSNSNTGSTFRPVALTACLACYSVMDSRYGTLLLLALWKSSIARHVPCKDTPMQQEKSSGGSGGRDSEQTNASQHARAPTHPHRISGIEINRTYHLHVRLA